ncbi:Putative 3-oxo-5-alpha-steroid 4-dehydrogenase, polyprenol reductase [Septoria linicola]|uniref:Polyprenal reductase n=1 Tax=Septoria linicola TaxID=215465 RepID=A0A9Q9AKK0_9PEZI|nr:putative 3-oxo-5-alpha-steroid 4-dehydrogenase, polyprenol reductase [Septoria linicola]USW47772.1 Putative 3-oxo-5-alpha-steroid 4-dehydrogenase, polyprenol reductase [Septoria linicola]
MALDVVLTLRIAYLAAATLIMVIFAIPPLGTRFLSYGARSSAAPAAKKEGNYDFPYKPLTALLDWLAGVSVPHSWFASFYAISVGCSMYWAVEMVCKGPAFTAIASCAQMQSSSMTLSQVQVAWLVMFAQGSRRLYECTSLSRPSASQMWVGHWALGVLFYVCTNIALWAQAIPTLQNHAFSLQDLKFAGPSLRSFVGILIFMLASGLQHDCHAYLASLKSSPKDGTTTYKMPEHPAWNLSLTPHYFSECLIYLALALVAAPTGQLVNGTLLCALIFVVVNLGVTAHGTEKWYTQKFGTQQTQGRAKMIPLVY